MSSLLIEINGNRYSNFESASVAIQLDAISGQFDFEAVSTKAAPLPIKLGDACFIIVDDEKVLTGSVESVGVSYDASTHSISISGRSKTSDLIDSMINSLELIAPITLKEVIEKVIAHIGASINVINNVSSIESFNSAEDLISPEVGENAFDFIEKLARKRQVLLTCDGNGDVVITQSGAEVAPSSLQNVIGGNQNNIEAADVSYSNLNRFGKYVAKSQLNLVALNNAGETDSKSIVAQKSPSATDDEVSPSRQLVIQSESASSDAELQKRIDWEANIRKTRSTVYSTTINGFSIKGKLWKPNQIVMIKDDFAGINARMLINSVIFNQEGSSSRTSIAFVNKNSYTLKLNEPVEGNILGEGLTS